jgi:hypothetical protein
MRRPRLFGLCQQIDATSKSNLLLQNHYLKDLGEDDVITYISADLEILRFHSVVRIGYILIFSIGDTMKKQLFSIIGQMQIPYNVIGKKG